VSQAARSAVDKKIPGRDCHVGSVREIVSALDEIVDGLTRGTVGALIDQLRTQHGMDFIELPDIPVDS
jgi:hypothetical protein